MSDPFGDLVLALGAFHLLRPLWLLLLVPILALWWLNRRAATRAAEPMDGIAPHLRAALSVGGSGRRRILPIDGVALVLGLAVVGAAGPSWTRQADPFAAQAGPLVVVLKVTPSMTATDLAPSRLERAKFKIRDLLALRAGARTALVAYAGTAHRVVPFTEDADLMQPYLEGLTPEIMPEPGADSARALAMAREMLAEEEAPGGILLVLDTLDPGGAAALLRNEEEGSAMALEMLPADAPRTEWPGRLAVVRTTADDADIRRLDRSLEVDFHRAMLSNEDLPWEDRGWWLAVPAAILTLIWFRRGWTMHWAAVLGALMFTAPEAARADGIADWFWTPDQQGARAYARNDFSTAADLFVDPMWKAHALYRAGRYDEAITVLERLETAQAAFLAGLAHIKNRQYRDGVRAFETALARDPNYPGAAENLALARRIVEHVEAAREASDSGEHTGVGADDVVFDNESGRGAETTTDRKPREGGGLLTAEQWMNTVDTRTGDFLRMRFQLEAARAAQ